MTFRVCFVGATAQQRNTSSTCKNFALSVSHPVESPPFERVSQPLTFFFCCLAPHQLCFTFAADLPCFFFRSRPAPPSPSRLKGFSRVMSSFRRGSSLFSKSSRCHSEFNTPQGRGCHCRHPCGRSRNVQWGMGKCQRLKSAIYRSPLSSSP